MPLFDMLAWLVRIGEACLISCRPLSLWEERKGVFSRIARELRDFLAYYDYYAAFPILLNKR